MNEITINRSLWIVIFTGMILTLASGCSYFKKGEEAASNDAKGEKASLKKEAAKAESKSRDNRKFTITTIPSGRIYFNQTSAKMKDGMLVIKGWVKSRYTSTHTVAGGHVDIKVFDPDDIILHESSVYQTPRVIHRISGRVSKFKEKIEIVPPTDSRVVVWFHRMRKLATSRPH